MCCTIGEYEAILSGTRIYAGEATLNNKYVHVLAYQNNAESDGPNAMILPFPTDVPMTQDNVIKTTDIKDCLNDIVEATKVPMKSMRSLSFDDDSLIGAAVAGVAQVFHTGSYTVILADHVAQVPEALKRVAENRRPTITTQFLLHYGRLYPKQPVALCCWDGRVEDIEPLLWWYEPKNPGNLFIPTMDAHDGGPPDLKADVHTDHIITVGSHIFNHSSKGQEVSYSDHLPDNVAALLPTHAHGYRVPRVTRNGDSFVSIAQLRGASEENVLIKRGSNVDEIHSTNRMSGWVDH